VSQIQLFKSEPELPEGFVYKPELISQEEEQALVRPIEQLEFADVKMHDVVAKRRVVHFGRSYHYESAALGSAPPIPEFLASLRQRVSEFAGRDAEEFAEILVTDYPPGAPIGWHRDAPAFDIIVGVSLLGECSMQFRRWPVVKSKSKRTKPLKQIVEPRSAYILQGPSRTAWQHRIPPVKQRRLSITFRTLRVTHA
jgi:alkylated DNA repair dioxygenase AlkB